MPATMPAEQNPEGDAVLAVRDDIIVRHARPDDDITHVVDHTGTGSGVDTGDAYLLQEFKRNVLDKEYTVLMAEIDGQAVGMITAAWASARESYWQSLRVAESARKKGLGKLLFSTLAQVAVARQGPDSISRWGIVSANTIMTNWSERMKLPGPQRFRRYGCKPSEEAPSLPEGYVLRDATAEDREQLTAKIEGREPGFVIAASEFGTQNFVRVGWGEMSGSMFDDALAGLPTRGQPTPTPKVMLHDGAIVAMAVPRRFQFGEQPWLMYCYVDGTEAGARAMWDSMPHIAHKEGCTAGSGGYVPTIDFALEYFDNSPIWERGTQTEQHEYHWRNADFVA